MKNRYLLLTLLLACVMPLLPMLSKAQALYTESFNYPAGQIPPDWVLEAEQTPPWKVNESNMAGGESPELYLGYSFAAGFSRLISPVIDITGQQNLHLQYKQYLINYEMDYGEIIGMDVTFDGGETWQVIWQQPLGTLNIIKDVYHYYVQAPEGATGMQFAFRYEGNSYAINLWLIDDIVIEPALSNDLLALSLTGSITPIAEKDNLYTARLVNTGSQAQDDYTVTVKNTADQSVIASIDGEPLQFGDTATYTFTWKPDGAQTGSTGIFMFVESANDENFGNNAIDVPNITIQPESMVEVEIGDGYTPVKFVPYNFFNLYSFTQTLYFPDEIGQTGKPIIGIRYTAQFDEDEQDVHIQLSLGETTRTDLVDEWVDPSTLKPVFDGMVSFRRGINDFFLPFDEAYTYNGGNLVVQSLKGYSEQYLIVSFINTFDSLSQRSRGAERDDAPFSPTEAPPFGYTIDVYPNIGLIYSTDPIAVNNISPSEVSLYPNPVRDRLFLQSIEPMTEVVVTNLIGQEVLRMPVGKTSYALPASGLSQGMYIVQIYTEKGVIARKFYKQE